MNPTRELITDLLPAYFSGEASADTRALVEEFFAQDPEFERMARRLAGSLNTLRLATPGPDEELERRALMRTRMELRGKNLSLGVALAGVVAIVLLVATNGGKPSAGMPVYIFLIVAGIAVYAVMAKRTRNTGV
jgi:ferric-dicitrate binding protein FerR (iron transport regulator)